MKRRDDEATVRSVVPWVASAGLHAGLVLLGFVVTWTVISRDDEREPRLVVADFNELTYDPLVRLDTSLDTEQPLLQTPRPEPLEEAIAEQLARLEPPTVHLAAEAAGSSGRSEFGPPRAPASASFVGLTTTNARRIVYVIDASGSMIRSLQIVVEELARSLDRLSRAQEFGVIFFQRNEAVMVPPTSRLVSALGHAKVEALQWIEHNVIPAGRSNPLAAIELALGFEPDVIFLLSENITGSGQFEIDQAQLLELLDQLNPTDPGSGRRRTRINCVQFLYPDPIDTLRQIADRHGGPGGYKFLDAAELGLRTP